MSGNLIKRMFSSSKKYDSLNKVLIEYKNNTCLMILNNPKAFNAMDEEMFHLISDELDIWHTKNSYPKNLIIKSNHPKAFCAGGDILKILELYKENAPVEERMSFFKNEFEIDYKMANLQKKGIKTYAFWNGIVMGGGVGVSCGFDYKISTPKTLFAMPESRIGLFVDVAVSYYLNQLEEHIGRHMATLGHRLKASNAYFSGISNCYLMEEHLQILEEKIIQEDDHGINSLLDKGSNYQAQNLEEGISWISYYLLTKEIMSRVGNDIKQLKNVYLSLEKEFAEPNSTGITLGWNQYPNVLNEELTKSKNYL